MNEPLGLRNYSQFADRYAEAIGEKPHNAYYERPATLSLLPDVAGLDVLDAGCGPGVYAEWLVERGARVTAVDVTPRMVELTRERLRDRVQALVHDLADPLTFAPDASFDLIVSPLVLEYIPDWVPIFAEFHRVLRPGGFLVFSCGHPGFEFYVLNPSGRYHETEYFELPWKGFQPDPPVVGAWRRPLEKMINPLLDAGLRLDRILEPKPTERFREVDPEHYEKLINRPIFLCVRAVKP